MFGGVGQNPQVTALRKGVDIVVACPGRLEDLIKQGHCTLANVEITVLDEADHMADLGFLPSVRRLLSQDSPQGSQRLLFSATLDRAIDGLVRQFLTNPVTHQADSAQSPVATMSHHVLHVDREARLPILVDLASAPGRTMVFTRTKRGAKTLARQLNANGVPSVELHGNLSQNARTRNMDAFHTGKAAALVATDIAARGIHVDDVALVDPRRSADRAQGVPAPFGSHGARRQRGDRRDPDDERAVPRRPRAHQSGRHQADDHADRWLAASDPDRTRSGGTAVARRARTGRTDRDGSPAADGFRRWVEPASAPHQWLRSGLRRTAVSPGSGFRRQPTSSAGQRNSIPDAAQRSRLQRRPTLNPASSA